MSAGALSRGSGSGGGVRSDKEEYEEKEVRGQGEKVMRPRSVTKRNDKGERVRGKQRGGGRVGEVQVEVVVVSGYGADGI